MFVHMDDVNLQLQKSLIMFPGLLIPMLDKCSIVPDAQVAAHPFFGTRSQLE